MSQENAEQKYKDIIDLPRPEDPSVFRRHPRMPVSERAKIFSPFAALRGYDEQLAAEDERLAREPRREFSEEESARLSAQLASLEKGMQVRAKYFHPEYPGAAYGSYEKTQGTLTAMDPAARTLRIDEITIPFQDLSEITRK